MAIQDLLQMIMQGGGGAPEQGGTPPFADPALQEGPGPEAPVTPNLGLDAAAYTPAPNPLDDFRAQIADLKAKMGEDPAKYRAERFKETWMGKHPVLGGITEFLAGLGKQESPTKRAIGQIDQDFATKKSLNNQVLQTLLGEQRANQASQNADFAKSRDTLKNDLAKRGLDLRTAESEFKKEQAGLELELKRQIAQGKDVQALENLYLKNQQLQRLLKNDSSGYTLDQMRKELHDKGLSAAAIQKEMRPQKPAGLAGMGKTVTEYDGLGRPVKTLTTTPGGQAPAAQERKVNRRN